jgi:hypothetical protein
MDTGYANASSRLYAEWERAHCADRCRIRGLEWRNTPRRHWRVLYKGPVPALEFVELRHVDWLDAEKAGVPFEETRPAVARALDRFLSPEHFASVIMLEARSVIAALIGRRQRLVRVTSRAEAQERREHLLKGMQRGSEAVCIVAATPEQVRDWFGAAYELATAEWRDVTESTQPVAYMAKALAPSVLSLRLAGETCAFIVAHDHDPVYIIRRKRHAA